MALTPEQIERKHQQDLQRLRGFRLMDDDFMTKCFEGEPACIELVLQIIIEKADLKVLDVRTQVFVENLLEQSVRLDILATDAQGAKYNIEIQRSDKGAGYKRARYHSSMIDVNLLEKGESFDRLPETYVIFITANDVIGEGKPVYRIGRCFLDSGKIFEDGTHILYVNGAFRGDSPIGRLMHDFACTDPSEMNYNLLADRVRYFKESKEGVATMCKVIEDMRREERREATVEYAKRMLDKNKYGVEEVADIFGLSVDEVEHLKKSSSSGRIGELS